MFVTTSGLHNVNSTVKGETVLYRACREGETEVFESLLGNPRVDNYAGETSKRIGQQMIWLVLRYYESNARMRQYGEIFDIVVNGSSKDCDYNLNWPNTHGNTVLSQAIEKGIYRQFKDFWVHPRVERTAGDNMKDEMIWKAFGNCMERGFEGEHLEMFKAVFYCKEFNALSREPRKGRNGPTILTRCWEENLEDVYEILKKELDIEEVFFKEMKKSRILIFDAIDSGNLEFVRKLVENELCDVNELHPTLDITPLLYACQHRPIKEDIIYYFCGLKEVDRNASDKDGQNGLMIWQTPFFWCAPPVYALYTGILCLFRQIGARTT